MAHTLVPSDHVETASVYGRGAGRGAVRTWVFGTQYWKGQLAAGRIRVRFRAALPAD